ncbi:unnamed protein product [Echinostoma caproni]|uniref:Fibronectin type-III domain-containing protein n=1 Tax=Echinostoma caproni TaxID=27848 RepID=A0A182ZZV3_9TREM|nr:unnamed protein product [Echinostoma caproni]
MVSDKVAQARWQTPDASLTFRVGYMSKDDGQMYSVPEYQTWYDLKTKEQCSYYTIWLFAPESSPPSTVSTALVKTKPYSKPSNDINVKVDPDCGSLNVSWTQQFSPDDFIETFDILVIDRNGTKQVFKANTGTQNVRVENLECDMPYLVTVVVVNACGRSAHSIPMYVIARKEGQYKTE